MNKKKINFNRILFYIFLTIFVLTLIVISVSLIKDYIYRKKLDGFKSDSSSNVSSVKLVNNPINFSDLKAINDEIYAWIRIPNTNIDYPVAQSATDDNYYLHHNIYGKYEFAGTIYSEMQNRKDFSDRNTVLYGHNMTKGYMFRQLYRFQDEVFFNENREFYIYTPNKIYTYTVYTAYQYDDRHILNSFDFSDDDVFKDYIESTKNPPYMLKNVRQEVNVTIDDKIITLSTCIGNGKTYRYLVQGVLTNVQETFPS